MSLQQLDIDFGPPTLAAARARRDEAMDRIAEKAEKEAPGFVGAAYAFLARYAASHSLINPEEVSFEAARAGIKAHDARAWGPIFRKACRCGLIRRSEVHYQRRYGHGTESRLWTSEVAR